MTDKLVEMMKTTKMRKRKMEKGMKAKSKTNNSIVSKVSKP